MAERIEKLERWTPSSSTETEIDALYSELQELTERAYREPELRDEISSRILRLRELQRQEAVKMRERFDARRRLKPGAGWDLLGRIDERLSHD